MLNYSPKNKGSGELSITSRQISDKLKTANPVLIKQICERLQEKQCNDFVDKFLNRDSMLVPAPSSSKLIDERALWTSREIANGLYDSGFGSKVLSCIERRVSIRSSHKSGYDRPSVSEHLSTLRVEPDLFKPRSITLIDDVVTRGSTAYACFIKLREAYPEIPIRLFAIMRTQGYIDNIDLLFELVDGEIFVEGDKLRREP